MNNAGQAQTERVQTAGNDAVESVKAAQGTATRAVETAKTEAIEAVQTEGATQAGNVSAEGEKQVQAVRGAAQEIIADREQIQENKTGIAKLKEDITTQMEAKLDKQQGVENAGKALVVGEDGNVVPQEETTKVEVDSTLTQSGKAADAKATGDKILQFAIKNTVIGESPLVVPDSAEEKMLGLKVFGKSEQVVTTGANILNVGKIGKVIISDNKKATAIVKEDGLYIVFEENDSLEKSDIYIYGNKFSELEGGYEEVPELVPGNYYIRNESSLLTFFVVAWRDSKYVILANSSDSLSHVFSVKQGDKFRIFLRPKFTNKNNILEKIMIAREKDLNIPYEPYTGGKQSPSPEYPQEIVSKKISEINIKKSLNLFDKSKLVKLKTIDTNGDIVNNGSSHVSGYIPVKPNTTYSMTGTNQTRGKFYQSDKKGIGTDYNFNPSKDTYFKTDENTHFIQFCLGTSNDGSNVMLNEGNTLLPYMDYAEEHQKITLSNSNVLLGIPVSDDGNITIDGKQYVSDVIKEKDGVIGIERNVKVVHAKDLTWRKDFYAITALDKYIYRFSCIDVEDIKLRCGMLSNRLLYNSSGVKDFGQISCEEKNKIRIAISESCNTLELFNKFLQDNEIIIYYQLDVPTFEPLPKVDQDAIKKLHTYYPNTTINTGTWTEVEYIADTKLYIDKKFEELSQAIVNTQIALL